MMGHETSYKISQMASLRIPHMADVDPWLLC
jgi:hypothetical protein